MIRILSDLHWGHKASRIKKLESIKNLIAGVDTVIFNGDTLEQKFEDSPTHVKHPLPSLGHFRDQIENWNANPVFITGNHDPRISNTHYCELNEGSILITHGDAIFKNIAPWSAHSDILKKLVERNLSKIEERDRTSFYRYLQTFKEASIEEHAILKDYDPSVWGKIQIFARQAWPPTRPLKILQCWRNAPKKAVELANSFGKSPKYLIIGHTHKPDIAVIGETTVINTGSFFPWPGASSVDIDSNGISIRKIDKRGNQFVVGKTIRRFDLNIEPSSLHIPAKLGKRFFERAETPFSI